jgi:hypothetical protein
MRARKRFAVPYLDASLAAPDKVRPGWPAGQQRPTDQEGDEDAETRRGSIHRQYITV